MNIRSRISVKLIVAVLPFFLIVLLVGILPFINVFYDSFFTQKTERTIFCGFKNYRYILSDTGFYISTAITVIWAILNTALTISIGFFIALKLNNRISYYRLTYPLLLIPIIVPIFIIVPLWRAFSFGDGSNSLLQTIIGFKINLFLDPIGSFITTAVLSIWLYLTIPTLILLGSMRNIPQYGIESATIDGASRYQIVRYIIFPQIREIIIALSIVTFIKRFKEFTVIFLMTQGGPPLLFGFTEKNIVGATTTLELYLYDILIKTRDTGISSALSFIVLVILIIFALTWLFKIKLRKNTNGKHNYHINIKNYPKPIEKLSKISSKVISKTHPTSILLTIILLLTLLLIYQILWMSLSPISTNFINRILPHSITLENFTAVIGQHNIAQYILNTLLLSIPTVLLLIVTVLPATYFLKNIEKKYAYGTIIGIQFLGVLSGMHSLIALYNIVIKLNLIDSYIPIVIIYTFHSIGIGIYIFYTFINKIPKSLKEISIIEGASSIYYTFKVLLPLSLPAIATISIVTFLNAWNGFLVPLVILNSDSKYPISLFLYSLVGDIGESNPQWNLFAASSLINLILLTIIFMPMRKFIVSSFLSGYENND